MRKVIGFGFPMVFCIRVRSLTTDRAMCFHCGSPNPTGAELKAEVAGHERWFCCNGCVEVCRMIHSIGEEDYYETREKFPEKAENVSGRTPEEAYDLPGVAAQYVHGPSRAQSGSGLLSEVEIQLQGIHCTSCVYLNERALSRLTGVVDSRVSYETGRAVIVFDPDKTKISNILRRIRSIGYEGRPIRPGEKSDALLKEGDNLLWRLGLAGFGAGNTMVVAWALWMGYFDGSLTAPFKNLFHWVEFALCTPVFFYAAGVFHRGWKALFAGAGPGMDLLISAGISSAFFYSAYVSFSGSGEVYFDSVTTIVFILLVGRYLEWRSRYMRRAALDRLIRPLPPHCLRDVNGAVSMVEVQTLVPGDVVLLEPGESVPTDGVLLSDTCEVDESVLTGESNPVLRRSLDRLLAGSRIVSGSIKFRVETVPERSGLAALERLASGGAAAGSGLEVFTRRTVPIFSTVVLTAAALSFGWFYFLAGAGLEKAIVTAISVLIVSCPCALALSVPSVVGTAIDIGLKRGILFRDGTVLESLVRAQEFCFDKTGTLTRGRPTLVAHRFYESPEIVAELVLAMEAGTSHPFGRALQEFARGIAPEHNAPSSEHDPVPVEIPGQGIWLAAPDGEYRLGRLDFACAGSDVPGMAEGPGYTVIALSGPHGLLAVFALRDLPRGEAGDVIRELRGRGMRVRMLTGDSRAPAFSVGRELGLARDEIFADMLAGDKVAMVQRESGVVCMVGDGYNDAPAFAASAVSVALARGAPVSLETAGIIVLKNDLRDLIAARGIAERARRFLRISFGFSLAYNSVMIPLAAAGLMLPVWCAVLMAASSLTVLAIARLMKAGA